MLMDEKGRLFGKINIIDLIIIIVLIAALAVVGIKILAPSGLSGSALTEKGSIEMQFYLEEANEWVVDKIKVGDTMTDGAHGKPIGVVTKVEKGAPIAWVANKDGEYVLSQREGFCSVTITGTVHGEKTANGVEIAGTLYGIGHSMVLHAGDAKLYLRVYDIQELTA